MEPSSLEPIRTASGNGGRGEVPRGQRILITGGTGFIGTALARRRSATSLGPAMPLTQELTPCAGPAQLCGPTASAVRWPGFMRLGISEYIDCAHFLPGHPKCGQLHGHTYRVDVTIDCTSVLDKFSSRPGAPPKNRSDLEPNPPDLLLNITDVTRDLDAFRGLAFPFAVGPNPCTQ